MKKLLAALLLVAGALAFHPGIGKADVPVNPNKFSTTASSGRLGPWACTGGSTATWTWTSGGGSAITIRGSADGVTGTYNTNTNFGTSGVVTNPSAGSTTSGNTANYMTGIDATFTGNSGTLSGSVTCSGGLATVGGGGGGSSNATIVSPLCDSSAAVCTFSLNAPLPTIAPGNFPGFAITDSTGATITAVTPTATPAAAAPAIPTYSILAAQCGTSGLICPISAAGQAATGAARNPLNVVSCNNIAATCQNITGTGADGTANTSMGAENVSSFPYIFNGTTWDRARKDTYAAGPQWVTQGGASTSSAPSAATTVIKNSAGRLATLLVTTVGTGVFTCFDNASAGSGTVIGVLAASAPVGTVEKLDMPAANGITCVSAASGPVVTVAFY